MGKRIKVNEPRRTTFFNNGQRADFHNVSWFDKSGTHLRLHADEGIAIINTDNVLYHLIQTDSDYQQTMPDSNFNPHVTIDDLEAETGVGFTGEQD